MMKNSSLDTIKIWLTIICTWSLFTGCATNLTDQERFKGQGFLVSTPGLQTRAVVWGNHSGAVQQATDWLNNEQILVLYRLADNDRDETAIASQATTQPQAHMLLAARRVGAPLVVFLQVKETHVDQKIDPMKLDDETPKILEVEVQGMNANTRDLIFGSTVWNSEPRVASDQLVMDLTTFALTKALKDPQSSSVPLQQTVPLQAKPGKKIIAPSARHNEMISPVGSTSPPVNNQPTGVPPKSVESADSGDKKKTELDVTPIAPSTDTRTREAELQASSGGMDERAPTKESSVGLQVASGVLSVFYTPLKVTYAVLGGFFGGFAYLLTGGNEEAASSVWDSSLGGTYWITPEHLQGNESIYFKGPPQSVEGSR